MSANMAALLLFLTLTGAMGLGYLAFAAQPSSKKVVKRLEAIRERAIAGEAIISGRLPVPLPGLAELGAGLDR